MKDRFKKSSLYPVINNMNSSLHLSPTLCNRLMLTALGLAITLTASAREILTERAAQDYEARLKAQPALAGRLSLPTGVTQNEGDALKFLYAYMSTPDALDYDNGYYLDNVRLALQAAEEMPWGKSVPDREWRHFVLPVRVNNENLDESRRVFYEELKPRVKDLSIEDAILEVNHWCHEKVSYQPSDPRTSSPLATVGNALGRCGEESTFTVAALRSVGIPARQVYTPRWAHTDDNHAWVEAWANGRWYFLGACEPEAVLDLAWFNSSASRGMLMTTKVTGAYDGPEEQLEMTPITTIINVTENYAPVETSTVIVTDTEGKPLKDASVRFALYNYAEFFPMAVKRSDENGMAQFISGRGDMVIWASDGRHFNYSSMTAGDTLRLRLDKDRNYTGSLDLDLVPPAQGGKLPEVSPEAAALNDRRKAYEDSVRLAYVATFLSPDQSAAIASELGLGEKGADLLVKSRGNHQVIESFLRSVPESQRQMAVNLLGALAEKDLHDVTIDVLDDHLYHTKGDPSDPLYIDYVLNPRIEYEMIRPYKQSLREALTPAQAETYRKSPQTLVRDLASKISLDRLYNPGMFRQSATSTYNSGVADALNRSIAFVAICRSLGIPARIDPVSHTTQYADTVGNWQDVTFPSTVSEPTAQAEDKSVLHLNNISSLNGRDPKYYAQFTVSQINEGQPSLMDFDDFETFESINSRNYPLVQGQYMIVSGQRLADGTVLAHTNIFNTSRAPVAEVDLLVRQDTTALQVIGSLNAELLYTPFDVVSGEKSTPQSILSTTGRGYYVLGLITPGHEPSSHALNDMAVAAADLQATGRTLLLLFPDSESASRFRLSDYGKLPSNVVFGIDEGGIIADALRDGLEYRSLTLADYPMFVVADSFNRIILARRGYTIHLGELLARTLREVE